MSDIIANKERVSNFTSSEIYRLMSNSTDKVSPGAPFFTYVKEKIHETKLKRSLDTGGYSQSAAWGLLLEKYVHDFKLGIEYIITSNETTLHPNQSNWSGSKDVWIPGVLISDIKCYWPKNFCEYADVLEQQDIETLKSEYKKEYWQLVSNAAINRVSMAEVILYMPYLKDLEGVRDFAANYDGSDQWKYRFIFENEAHNLPYVPDDSDYKDLYQFRFEVPEIDTNSLRNRVELATFCLENGITNMKQLKKALCYYTNQYKKKLRNT